MDTTLTQFIHALRTAGLPVSPAETLDAARVAALLGFADREALKSAFNLTLAKTADDKQVHDTVFERFFASAAAPATDPSTPDSHPVLDDTQVQLALEQAARSVDVNAIRWATQVPYYTRQILKALEQQQAQADRPAAAFQGQGLGQAETATAFDQAWWQPRVRQLVQQRFALYGAPATEAFMADVAVQRPIGPVGRMAPADYQRLKTAVQRMARRLAQRHARRQRRLNLGKLDLRNTLRHNAGHDHIPFHLRWRYQRRDKPRIVVVCDVSGSVAAQVRFLLLLLYALHGTVLGLRSFAFSHRLVEVSELMDKLPFEQAMDDILHQIGGGATDYGQAWLDLEQQHEDAIDRRTTLLVLGDGRSNGTNPRLDLFAQFSQRAARTLWLSPETPGRWGSGDSCLLQYRPWCHNMLHCQSVNDFERVIDDLLRAAS